MKLVVTGASGAIGQALLARLYQGNVPAVHGIEVHALTSSSAAAHHLKQRFPAIRAAHHGTWRMKPLQDALVDADVLLHLAWSSVPGTAAMDPAADFRENVTEVLPLLDVAARCGVGRVVFVSSGGTVYGPMLQRTPITEEHTLAPVGAYGLSKLGFERLLDSHAALHGYATVVLRPSNVYGMPTFNNKPQGVVQHWMQAIAAGRPIELWNEGVTMRDFIHIDDMVDALLLALGSARAAGVFNVATGLGTSLAQLVTKLASVTGRTVEIVHRDGPVGAVERNVLSTVKARLELGFHARVPLDEGLQRTWRIYSGPNA